MDVVACAKATGKALCVAPRMARGLDASQYSHADVARENLPLDKLFCL
jgi:hypothetical protein